MSATRLYEPVPFKLNVDKQLLDQTKAKLSLARYPTEEVTSAGDWSQGTRVAELKEAVEYWRNIYDWEKEQVHTKRSI